MEVRVIFGPLIPALDTGIHRQDFAYLKPAPQHMARRRRSIPAQAIRCLDYVAKQAKEQEEIPLSYSSLAQMPLCGVGLSKERLPSSRTRQAIQTQVRVEVSAMHSGNAPTREIAYKATQVIFMPTDVGIPDWGLMIKDRQGQQATIRENGAWATAGGGVEAFSAQDKFHEHPNRQEASFGGYCVSGELTPTDVLAINFSFSSQDSSITFTKRQTTHRMLLSPRQSKLLSPGEQRLYFFDCITNED